MQEQGFHRHPFRSFLSKSPSIGYSFQSMSDFPAADTDFMQLAIAEARAAEAAGEVPVGAIIVSPNGQIVGRGNNQVLRTNDPTAHAEIVALRAAGLALSNYRIL